MTLPILRTVELNRQGNVKVRVAGSAHCGHPSSIDADGNVLVRYTVRLKVGPNSLGVNDFLVDQESLHTLLVGLGSDPVPWHESCELLTVVWGDRLLEWISMSNPRCVVHEFALTLSPAPHMGSFTSTYTEQVRAASVALTATA